MKSLINLFQSGSLAVNKVLMAYDPNQKDGVYGLLGVPLVVHDGIIYKAEVSSIPKGTDILDTQYWKPLEMGGGATALNVSYDVSSLEDGTHYIVSTSSDSVVIELPIVDDGYTISFKREGINPLTLESSLDIDGATTLVLQDGDIYRLTFSNGTWVVYMKEVANTNIGSVSHLVGFGVIDGILFVDIIALTPNTQVDIDKYNLTWLDGTPSWKIVDSSVATAMVDTYTIELKEV